MPSYSQVDNMVLWGILAVPDIISEARYSHGSGACQAGYFSFSKASRMLGRSWPPEYSP